MSPRAAFVPHAWQLSAAEDYQRLGGVFLGLDPGAGKTYAFARIAARCQRPLVVCPAAAVAQTMTQFERYGVPTFPASQLHHDRNHGASAGAVIFASYTWLTRAEQADFFEVFQPTDVLMDEFHVARGLNNSARKRLERHLVARPAVRVAVATASPMSGRVHDFAFGLHWALRAGVRGLVPPLRAGLDALQARLETSEEARADFRRRLEATPGVYLDVGDVGRYAGRVELSVVRRAPSLVLPDTWETPSGFLVESAAHAAEVERQLAWGFYHDVQPRPSDAYCAARRAWGGVVRRCVDQGFADTEYQVRAFRPAQYTAWAEAAEAEGPLAEPTPVWGSTTHTPVSLQHSLPDGPTLVWARHRALQELCATVLRVPLFREGARTADGTYLPDYRGRLAVVSNDACFQSLNLQHFCHNVFLQPEADPEWWKQAIGRTARQGQTEPRVTCNLVVSCPADERALRNAIDKAVAISQITGKGSPLLQLQHKKDW